MAISKSESSTAMRDLLNRNGAYARAHPPREGAIASAPERELLNFTMLIDQDLLIFDPTLARRTGLHGLHPRTNGEW